MKKRSRIALLTALLTIVFAAGISVYSNYIGMQIYQESSNHLLESYAQISKTFTLFVQRNWTVLSQWDSLMKNEKEDADVDSIWSDAQSNKLSWHYSDFYLFNESTQYLTADGRKGSADSIDGVFQEMYSKGEPIVSTYTATYGVPKIAFAMPMSRNLTLDGVTYTGIAVSYDTDMVDDLVDGSMYGGQSDCYVVRSNGDIVLKLEPQTELCAGMTNLYDLSNHADWKYGSMDDIKDCIQLGKSGSAQFTCDGTRNYLVAMPTAFPDWSLVGIIQADEVDGALYDVQNSSLILLGALCFFTVIIVVLALGMESRLRLKNEEMERLNLEREKMKSDRFLQSMSRIVDRYAVVNLDTGRYRYHELRFDQPIYPINDVLDMSRIESGKVSLELRPVQLPELVHDLRDIIQPSITAKRISLFIDMVDVEDENVVADPMRLNQIMLNILSNAIKFTPVGGMITLRIVQKQTAPHGSADYEFHIRDTGIGMSSAFQEHIFEQFAREETSTVSKIQGTGLGMAITKNLVDMMGGNISVESEPGKGSKFTVSLRFPISGEQAAPQRIPQLEGLRALVADDDTDTCLNVSKMLRMIGMRSDWTTSGHEAVVRTQDAIEQGDGFYVFIIDWMIPDLNGLEVVRRIRKLIGSNTPIIILTAYDWTDIEVEAKAAGVTAFCAKPLFMSELRRVLAEPFLSAEPAEQTEKKADFAGKRLLVVEDNALNREIAVTMLEEGGFEVDTAENGKVAVDKVRESAPGHYDLVLMDIQMPIMDGYAAARAIRALPDAEKAGLPIVAMTANAFDEDRQNAEKAGMNGHLSKPFDMQQLLTMLREKLSP